MKKPRILLADDNSRFLRALSQFLSTRFEVVGCVINGEQAIQATMRLQPDVLVLDILMPLMDGMEAARQLKQIGSPARIVFLSGLEDTDYMHALEGTADGYVFKSRLYIDLPLAIQAALGGGVFCSSKKGPQQ